MNVSGSTKGQLRPGMWERGFCTCVFKTGFRQEVKMSWAQKDGNGPGSGEGREGFLEGICMCVCECVYVCQKKPKTGSRVSRVYIYMARKNGQPSGGFLCSRPSICMCDLPPPLQQPWDFIILLILQKRKLTFRGVGHRVHGGKN